MLIWRITNGLVALNAQTTHVRMSTIVCFYIKKDVKTVKESFRHQQIRCFIKLNLGFIQPDQYV